MLKVLLYAMALNFSSAQLNNHQAIVSSKISVVGQALNQKIGAVVVADSMTYIIDGLHSWDKNYYGKKVKVTGKLKIVVHEEKSTYPGEFQEMIGTLRIIKKPKWSLVE